MYESITILIEQSMLGIIGHRINMRNTVRNLYFFRRIFKVILKHKFKLIGIVPKYLSNT